MGGRNPTPYTWGSRLRGSGDLERETWGLTGGNSTLAGVHRGTGPRTRTRRTRRVRHDGVSVHLCKDHFPVTGTTGLPGPVLLGRRRGSVRGGTVQTRSGMSILPSRTATSGHTSHHLDGDGPSTAHVAPATTPPDSRSWKRTEGHVQRRSGTPPHTLTRAHARVHSRVHSLTLIRTHTHGDTVARDEH